jgi:hypothetical protein
MRWNLRLTAAKRCIWKAPELRHLLARHELVMPDVAVAGPQSPGSERSTP